LRILDEVEMGNSTFRVLAAKPQAEGDAETKMEVIFFTSSHEMCLLVWSFCLFHAELCVGYSSVRYKCFGQSVSVALYHMDSYTRCVEQDLDQSGETSVPAVATTLD
jgi:hypothetical protein